MLCCRNFINDQNPSNNQWVEILISAYTIFPMIIYLLICLILIGSAIPDERPGREARGSPLLVVICLMFVSLSVVLFAYLRSVNPGIYNLIIVSQKTLLIMNAIALFIFFLATFVNPTVNKQISDIDTEEKKAGGIKLLNKVNLKNYASTKLLNKVNLKYYASMDDTETLIEI